MKRSLEDANWDTYGEMDVEAMWNSLHDVIMEATNEHVPILKRNKGNHKLAPWWTKKLLNEVKLKHAFWKAYQQSKTEETHQTYAMQRNKTTQCIKNARQQYEKKLSTLCKQEPKRIHTYIRNQLKVKPQVKGLETTEGKITGDNQEAADILNKFFQSVFTTEGTGPLPEFHDRVDDGLSLTDIQVTETEVHNQLLNLQEGKAGGPDGIPTIVLKRCADQLTKPVTTLFNRSLQAGMLPLMWKRARITPIFKKGSMKKPQNYRPVSLTCQLCKVLERLILKEVCSHLERNNLLSTHQHGFTKGRSCQTNLLESLEEWTRWLDECHSVDVIYLDYQKAFDKVPHKRLIKKLEAYGIKGNVLKWIQSFLTDRSQLVTVGQSTSSIIKVTSGVPQGSVLGPLLFILYVNELPEIIQSQCKLFADDTKLFRRISSAKDCEVLQSDLNKLMDWSSKWLLKFNTDKCKVMHCGHANATFDYAMNDDGGTSMILKKTDLERDLGIIISKDLKATAHCDAASKKAMVALRLLKMTFSRLTTDNFKALYTTYVRPHMDYCLSAVGPHMAQDLQRLERVQRRATKLIREIRHLPYQERLLKLDLITIKDRALRGDLIEVYKILTGKMNIDPGQFFVLQKDARTRGHQLKLEKKRVSHHYRNKFFTNRVITPWNELPEYVVSADSVNSFKRRLDRYWASRID